MMKKRNSHRCRQISHWHTKRTQAIHKQINIIDLTLVLQDTCKCCDCWYDSPTSKSAHPPAIYNLHGEHDDRIQEWAIDECIVKVIKRAVVVEVVNKPIEKVAQYHNTLDSVKQEQKMHCGYFWVGRMPVVLFPQVPVDLSHFRSFFVVLR